MPTSAVTSPFALLGTVFGGVWTTSEATRAGVTPDRLRQLVGSGEWRRIHRGVFHSGGIEPDARMSAFAALLATSPPAAPGRSLRGLATGRTAARVLDLPLLGCPEGEDVLIAGSRSHHGLPGVRVVRASGPLGAVLVDGLPLSEPARVLLDLAPLLRLDALVCVLDALLRRDVAVPVDGSGRWSRKLARVRVLADGRSESPLETLGRLAAHEVLPTLEPQVPVGTRRLDLACRRLRIALEGDGAGTHSGPVSLLADRRREESMPGWTFLRFGWHDVWPTPDPLQRRLRALLALLA